MVRKTETREREVQLAFVASRAVAGTLPFLLLDIVLARISLLLFMTSFRLFEEMADRDSELAEAHRRRNSNGAENQHHHVTGFLASQTLALFLAVPTHQQQPAIVSTGPTVR